MALGRGDEPLSTSRDAARRYSHFVHLHVLLVQGQLEVGVVGRWAELVARQHEEDQGGGLHQELGGGDAGAGERNAQ